MMTLSHELVASADPLFISVSADTFDVAAANRGEATITTVDKDTFERLVDEASVQTGDAEERSEPASEVG